MRGGIGIDKGDGSGDFESKWIEIYKVSKMNRIWWLIEYGSE